MPVREIRGFDADRFHVHNAFRSPGRLCDDELGAFKADVYQGRYEGFRKAIHLKRLYVDQFAADYLAGVSFAFVCVDKGTARSEIFDLLIKLRIPFIDCGLGLNRKQGPLAGTLRITYYPPDRANEIRALRQAEEVDDADDIYRKNVQLAELNALNAAAALIRFKQVRGFYLDEAEASICCLMYRFFVFSVSRCDQNRTAAGEVPATRAISGNPVCLGRVLRRRPSLRVWMWQQSRNAFRAR